MTILWTFETSGNHYQVRSAGRTVRLYTNGVFHSQFNPSRPLGGGVWDLLSLPAFFLPPSRCARVLLLGVGGGAVIRQLEVLMDSPDIVGVDLDAVHLRIAKRWFGVTSSRARLVHADAVNWLAGYNGAGFDLVIDDLFGECVGEPVRAVKIDRKWARSLRRVLNPGGVIVANYLDRREFRHSALVSRVHRDQNFRFEHPLYQNCVGVYVTQSVTLAQWRRRLMNNQQIDVAQKRIALDVAPTRVRAAKPR